MTRLISGLEKNLQRYRCSTASLSVSAWHAAAVREFVFQAHGWGETPRLSSVVLVGTPAVGHRPAVSGCALLQRQGTNHETEAAFSIQLRPPEFLIQMKRWLLSFPGSLLLDLELQGSYCPDPIAR
jgi:hypothetical protein